MTARFAVRLATHCVVGAQMNPLIETDLLSTNNIWPGQ